MRLLIELWPSLIPLLLLGMWWHVQRRRGRIVTPRTVWVALAASLAVLCALLVLSVLVAPSERGAYTPAHLEGGTLVPGHID